MDGPESLEAETETTIWVCLQCFHQVSVKSGQGPVTVRLGNLAGVRQGLVTVSSDTLAGVRIGVTDCKAGYLSWGQGCGW